jgi:Flp pilus assembly protein TadG
MIRQKRPARPAALSRRGAVTVEFAIVAPLVFMVVLGAVELARLNMLVNSMENAAYEGARAGIVPGATVDKVSAGAEEVLTAVGAVNGDVTVEPTVITSLSPTVACTIRIPLDDNTWVTPLFAGGVVLERTCTLNREQVSQ